MPDYKIIFETLMDKIVDLRNFHGMDSVYGSRHNQTCIDCYQRVLDEAHKLVREAHNANNSDTTGIH